MTDLLPIIINSEIQASALDDYTCNLVLTFIWRVLQYCNPKVFFKLSFPTLGYIKCNECFLKFLGHYSSKQFNMSIFMMTGIVAAAHKCVISKPREKEPKYSINNGMINQ